MSIGMTYNLRIGAKARAQSEIITNFLYFFSGHWLGLGVLFVFEMMYVVTAREGISRSRYHNKICCQTGYPPLKTKK
jgi:hypothetical protein